MSRRVGVADHAVEARAAVIGQVGQAALAVGIGHEAALRVPRKRIETAGRLHHERGIRHGDR